MISEIKINQYSVREKGREYKNTEGEYYPQPSEIGWLITLEEDIIT